MIWSASLCCKEDKQSDVTDRGPELSLFTTSTSPCQHCIPMEETATDAHDTCPLFKYSHCLLVLNGVDLLQVMRPI